MFLRLISIVFVMTMLAVISTGHVWAVTTGISDGVYDFGDLGANDSLGPGTGYARLGDKFKVGNDQFTQWPGVEQTDTTDSASAIYPDSGTNMINLPHPVVIKAEGGATCKKFTFKDMGISATWPNQKFDSFEITLKDIDGTVIYSKELGASRVYSDIEVTSLRALYSLQTDWLEAGLAGIASIEIKYSVRVNENGIDIPEYVQALNLENITIADVEAAVSKPSIFGIFPSSGPTSGGTPLTITGADFNASTVKFGGIDAILTVDSPTQITAVTPATTAPSNPFVIDIAVTNSEGTGIINAAFTYTDITGITPPFGSIKGGDTITINGFNFKGVNPDDTVNTVKFGTMDAESFTIDSDTKITAKTPIYANTETVDISVSTSSKTSTTRAADQFTFNDAIGKEDGKYDFGGLGLPDSAGIGTGFTRLGDKFKVGNNLFSERRSLSETGPFTAIYPRSSIISPDTYTAVIKAEDGSICKTFTFKDLGISATLDSQKFETFDIVLKDINGAQIGSTISLGSSPVYFKTSVINISNLYSPQGPWVVDGVAAIEISYKLNANSAPAKASDLNLENITVANVRVAPMIVPGAPTNVTVTAGNKSGIVDFTPPADNGGATISGYTVVSIPPDGVDINAGMTGLSHAITGLINDTQYTFTVTATNTVGTGTVSAASSPVTPTASPNSIYFDPPASATYGDAPITLTATASSGLPVSFIVSGPGILSGINSNILEVTGAGDITVKAIQSGDSDYLAALDVVKIITVTKATPTITWPNPADITYGTALSATQLNATASTAGTFAYTPASGTTLNAGAGQVLSVGFVPTDTTNYTPVTSAAAITVTKATPTITWSHPADITYGTALSATQLNATASTAGTFAYTPAPGIILNVGAGHTLSVSFVPTDTTNYNTPVTATTAISVITNLIDAINAYHSAVGLSPQPTGIDLIRYDVAPLDANGKPEGNGKIDIGDVVLMLRNVVGLVTW